jgi:hypothetical protein
MEAISTDPRTLPSRNGTAPVHHFHVVFWRQATAPEGRPQESMVWSAHYHEVVDAMDVHEVIAWADHEAQSRKAAYSLYAVTEYWTPRNEVLGEAVSEFERHEMAVWLGGWNPVKNPDVENFGRLLPPGAQPVWGDPEDVYRMFRPDEAS